MKIDKSLLFTGLDSASQPIAQTVPVTASVDTPSTDHLDLGATIQANGRPIGVGAPLFLVVVQKSGVAITTGSLQIKMQVDDNSAFSSPSVLLNSPIYSAFGANDIKVLPLPMDPFERYVRLLFSNGVTALSSAPQFIAFITDDPQQWIALADGL